MSQKRTHAEGVKRALCVQAKDWVRESGQQKPKGSLCVCVCVYKDKTAGSQYTVHVLQTKVSLPKTYKSVCLLQLNNISFSLLIFISDTDPC